jgi:hypothetical protein
MALPGRHRSIVNNPSLRCGKSAKRRNDTLTRVRASSPRESPEPASSRVNAGLGSPARTYARTSGGTAAANPESGFDLVRRGRDRLHHPQSVGDGRLARRDITRRDSGPVHAYRGRGSKQAALPHRVAEGDAHRRSVRGELALRRLSPGPKTVQESTRQYDAERRPIDGDCQRFRLRQRRRTAPSVAWRAAAEGTTRSRRLVGS